jgi:hypothetical protein
LREADMIAWWEYFTRLLISLPHQLFAHFHWIFTHLHDFDKSASAFQLSASYSHYKIPLIVHTFYCAQILLTAYNSQKQCRFICMSLRTASKKPCTILFLDSASSPLPPPAMLHRRLPLKRQSTRQFLVNK